MTDDAPEFEPDYPTFMEMGSRKRQAMVRELAFELFQHSCPNTGGPPSISPEECFAHAEAFVAEAQRRGY